MKYLLLLLFILTAERSFSQNPAQKKFYISKSSIPHITAGEAYEHRGELVIVLDSIYSGTIRDDSVAMCKVGPETNTPRLTAFVICSPQDRPLKQDFITTLQQGKISLMGILTGPKQFPVIIVHSDNIHELNVSPNTR